ncbi:hypothetical protein H7992_14380 [Sporosarcina sp. resist]|uniref:hypothetical protein n=1 Tax=Sporosarcina sp. resist TaxID=2762563 RepID=UPI00164DB2F0|nr:hypothetical protein [Sporosarcina sp. resist]QNK86446.1 hypothetical protein H7992_14380 [Sporosarcina sp. resist]
MSKDNSKKNSLNLHLIYLIIIFLIVLSVVGGLALYNQQVAISGLSNAGLLLSIVLAVIAILMTLWDVAGQKESLIKVGKSVDDLTTVSEGLEKLVSNALETIEGKQSELTVVTKALLEKTEVLSSAGTSVDFDEITKQLNVLQKGLEINEINEMNKKRYLSNRQIKDYHNNKNISNEFEDLESYLNVLKNYSDNNKEKQ